MWGPEFEPQCHQNKSIWGLLVWNDITCMWEGHAFWRMAAECVPPKSVCWKLTDQCDSVGRWLGQKAPLHPPEQINVEYRRAWGWQFSICLSIFLSYLFLPFLPLSLSSCILHVFYQVAMKEGPHQMWPMLVSGTMSQISLCFYNSPNLGYFIYQQNNEIRQWFGF
jgi:hypothetical protein